MSGRQPAFRHPGIPADYAVFDEPEGVYYSFPRYLAPGAWIFIDQVERIWIKDRALHDEHMDADEWEPDYGPYPSVAAAIVAYKLLTAGRSSLFNK